MDLNQILKSLPSADRELVQTRVPLRDLTSLGVGGPAALICSLENAEQAQRFHEIVQKAGKSLFILGGGSNVLADDAGFNGIVLKVTAQDFQVRGDIVTVGAGYDFDDLIAKTLDSGLTGLEFASGIPGTLGGAVVGNAGCYGHEIGEFFIDAQVLRPDGTVVTAGPEAFGFRYRETDLRETGHVVLEVRLKLNRGDVHAAGDTRAEKIADRRRKHPVGLPSAGSWFRNLPPAAAGERRRAAGSFLEAAGAKEMSAGNAHVFAKHANMIINGGMATSADVLRLAECMKKAVKDKFDLTLIEEVRYLCNEPETEE
jgi:UDP-N-acetylmuramate dehydrogenase